MGRVRLEKGTGGAEDKSWMQVRCGERFVTALDLVGARPGDLVMIAVGEGAGRLCPEIPVDAVIVGVAANSG